MGVGLLLLLLLLLDVRVDARSASCEADVHFRARVLMSASIQEATILDAIQSKTVTLLVESYGFELEKSVEAVLAIGDPSDAGLAVSWLLDNGEEDKGGAVEFIHCPHLDDASATPLVDGLHLPPTSSWGRCAEGCATKENWVCLADGSVRCSRYVNKHSLKYHESSGHATFISLSDLSIWCFLCDAYVTHPRLKPLVERMQALKFGGASSDPVCPIAEEETDSIAPTGKGKGKAPVAEPKRPRDDDDDD